MRTRKLVTLIAFFAMTIGLVVPQITLAAPSESDYTTWVMYRTWSRTDLPVMEGQVSRTWMWGPEGFDQGQEEYVEAPGGVRNVMYFDKSRMEENTWRNTTPPWDVTNGLLATELITGRMQMGDNEFVQYCPSTVNIAGDPVPQNPTYATYSALLDEGAFQHGSTITATVDKAGNVGSEDWLAEAGVTAVGIDSPTDHTVASVFWEFMNSAGVIYNADSGQYEEAQLFENPFYATGYPITEAYWAEVIVAGTPQPVLTQAFERRVLTFTPANPHGWQVEAGNVGQHYFRWRHNGEGLNDCNQQPPAPEPPAQPPAPTPPAQPEFEMSDALRACLSVPNNFDNTRYTVTDAPNGVWFHPIYNQGMYNDSNGYDGQWSWANSLCLGDEVGGRFLHFNNNDGRFEFRQDQVDAHISFGILTEVDWKSQFMSDPSIPFSINIETMDTTTVAVYNSDGTLIDAKMVSPGGGEITIILPDDGARFVEFYVHDPNAVKESKMWVGPYDRSENINTIDARGGEGSETPPSQPPADEPPSSEEPIIEIDGWYRVVTAGDGEECTNRFVFKAEVPDTAGLDFPHCGELRVQGEGRVKVNLHPDPEGYPEGEGLTWWPQGSNDSGSISILKWDGEWTGFITAQEASGGIDFPLDGGERRVEFEMTGGSLSLLLGPGGPGAL